jgi:cytochrome c2
MPASEQTWRNQRIMHVVFGVTTAIMLVSTIWMIAKDYAREWKDYQADYFQISRWSDQATLRQTEVQSEHDLRARRAELRAAQSQAVQSATLDQFKLLVEAENQRLEQAGDPPMAANFTAINEYRDRLDAAADRAEDLRREAETAHQRVVEAVAAAQAARTAAPAGEAAGEATQQALGAVEAARDALREAEEARLAAEEGAIAAKEELVSALDKLVAEARRREDEFVRKRKFVAATHTEKLSLLDAANAAGAANVGALQAELDQLKAEMDTLDGRAASAKGFRTSLEAIVKGDIQSRELEVQKEVDEIEQELDRLDAAIDQQGDNWKKQFVRAPIMEAFDTSDMQIDNGWLPELKINYNFSDVARFDRCATCHKAIEKTAPGSAIEPAYPTVQPEDQVITVQLATPESPPARMLNPQTGQPEDPSFRNIYGFTLAERGQLDASAVTVEIVLPESAAARAGLQTGDVIEEIAGGGIYNEDLVRHYLLEAAQWGQPVEVTIRRGLPHPYTSHPRLDLFVGSMSPHPKGEFGCTICHDGQGSSTTFKYASHSPNSPAEANEWRREHDWFLNHHWIFPMTPRRFIESNCLKCHHEVVELEPSERFPDPPAPQLVAGWKAILDYGCYGCHEVNGYDGGKRVGPDLRNEPNYFAAAEQMLRDPGLSDQERAWARAVVQNTYDDAARNKLRIAIEADAALATNSDSESQPRLSAATHKLGELLKDVENPGTLRRVGPSLRFLAHKVEFPWLYSWIERPSSFRPSTKMPQFFGQHNHLDDEDEVFAISGLDDEDDQATPLTDHEFTQRMEAIEVRAITEYLLSASGDFEFRSAPEGITERPSAERGKTLFQTRGCLACHTHRDFPGIAQDQGPDLSNLAAKLNTDKGRQWLYTWIRQPTVYHVRTNMPDLFLEPIVHADATGQPTGAVTDPAADIVAYLLSVPTDWTPQSVPQREALTADELKALESLALEWMTASFSARLSKEYLQSGIPESVAGTLKGDEIVFVGMNPEDRIATTLKYVGMRSIGKYGCFGCHDIPGFEAAKPIGTGLADWGRKDPSKLAFEQIHKFLMTHGIEGDQDPHAHAAHGEDVHGLDPTQFDADTGYFLQALNMHQREGFIWQKLRMPRSYDYLKTQNKGFNERLRMPQFSLTDSQREQIITFVLGLTAETPSEQYVFQPNERQRAIMDGRLLLSKYNCGGCHTLQMEKWDLAFAPGTLQIVSQDDYPFLAPEFSAEEVLASQEPDRRGLFHAEFTGMPVLSEQTGQPQRVDEGGSELTPEFPDQPYYRFTLYEPALVEGQTVTSGQQLFVPATWESYGPANGKVFPSWGGDFARYLFPHVLAMERQAGTQIASPEQAWGWLPPTLHAEGRKVQTAWLHDFLLNPYAIRPAVVLRMPRFNLSTAEASRLANFFAAVDNADYPYEYNERQQSTYLDVVQSGRPSHLQDAFNIVLDSKNFCAQCHSVGDYQTQQVVRQRGPNLAQAGDRLRADYLRRYIANPQKILPYTGMPINFPYGQTVAQNLYQGTGAEQIDAVVDVLANYDLFIQQHYRISPLVEAAARQAQGAEAEAGAGGE